jgi:hypothetical protein
MPLEQNTELASMLDGSLEYPLFGGVLVFSGAMIGLRGGFARPLLGGDAFIGIAGNMVDNRNGQDGDKTVRTVNTGIFRLPVAPLAVIRKDHVGKMMYAVDDASVSDKPYEVGLSVPTGVRENSPVGFAVKYDEERWIWVRLRS